MAGFDNDRPEESAQSSQGTTSELDASQSAGPLGYLRQAIRIARFDVDAITRASQDKRAILYGAGVLGTGILTANVSAWLLSGPPAGDESVSNRVLFVVGAAVVVPLQVLVSAINVGIIHGAARLVFGATGRYVHLLRVLWLGSVVLWLNAIPIVGALVGSVWFLLITLVTFEEVDGVERLQALALVVGLAALMFLARAALG